VNGGVRLQYSIGEQTLADILSLFGEKVHEHVIMVTTPGKRGNDAIMLSKTEFGKSWITFLYLKHSDDPWVSLKEY